MNNKESTNLVQYNIEVKVYADNGDWTILAKATSETFADTIETIQREIREKIRVKETA